MGCLNKDISLGKLHFGYQSYFFRTYYALQEGSWDN